MPFVYEILFFNWQLSDLAILSFILYICEMTKIYRPWVQTTNFWISLSKQKGKESNQRLMDQLIWYGLALCAI